MKEKNGFQLRKQKKMDGILRAAVKLFSRRGVKEVTIAEIAKKAGVSQVSIYNYFGSKRDLARQAVFAIMNENMAVFETLVNSDLSFQEKFGRMVWEKMQTRDQYGEEFIQSDIWMDPDIQAFLDEFIHTRVVPLMLELVEQGRREGCVNPEISDRAILVYIRMFYKLAARENFPVNIKYELAALFFYGLLGMPANHNRTENS